MDFTSEASGAVVARALQDISDTQKKLEAVIKTADYLTDLERIACILFFAETRLKEPDLDPYERLFYEVVCRKCHALDAETRDEMHAFWDTVWKD